MPTPKAVPTDLPQLLGEALVLYQGLLPGVTFERRFDPAVTEVRLDPEQIKRVIINLVDNAIEAMNRQGTLVIEIPESQKLLGVEATIWVARLASSRAVEIGGGENSGKSITYSNVARELTPIGLWRGEAVRLEAPAKAEIGETYDRLAVIVQRNDQGPILGAGIIDLGQ